MSAGGRTRAYCVWTPEEEEQLRNGVSKHGLGSWEIIRRDPEFELLEHRSGVQLKDKWRNLVKFRHISAEVSRTLKPKTSGPWSKKHSAAWARERSASLPPPPQPEPPKVEQPEEEEPAAALLTLEQQRSSGRAHARSRVLDGYETTSDADDARRAQQGATTDAGPSSGAEMDAGQRKKKRRLCEDRRFGIYDQRRYGPGGMGGGGGATSAPPARRGRGRGSGSGRRGGSVISDEEDTDEELGEDVRLEEDEDDDEEGDVEAALRAARARAKSGRGGRGGRPGGSGAGAAAGAAPTEGVYMVSCLCGVTYDDGAMMIECEGCGTWVHLACLQQAAAAAAMEAPGSSAPHKYDFEHYKCDICQAGLPPPATGRAQGAGASGRPMGARGRGAAAAAGPEVKADPDAGGRPRRQRKVSSRYRDIFAPLEELDDLDGPSPGPGGREAREGRGTERGGEKDGDGPCTSGHSQHSSKSSRDKTNEASTLLLGLAKAEGSGGGGGGGGGGGAGAWPPVERPRSRGPGSARSGGSGGRSSHPQGQQGDEQLELFLANGGPRSASRNGLSRHHSAALLAAGGYPGRTASPATAALAAAAALAMKEHEAELSARAAAGAGGAAAANDALAALYALNPAAGGGGESSLPAPKPMQHPALARNASRKSLLGLGAAAGAEAGVDAGTAAEANGQDGAPAGGTGLKPGGHQGQGQVLAPSASLPSAQPGGSASASAVGGGAAGVLGGVSGLSLHMPPLLGAHHQQLLASLGLDGRQSPGLGDMLHAALAGRRVGSPALGAGHMGRNGLSSGGGAQPSHLGKTAAAAATGAGAGAAPGGGSGSGGGGVVRPIPTLPMGMGSVSAATPCLLPTGGLGGDSDEEGGLRCASAASQNLLDTLLGGGSRAPSAADPFLLSLLGSRASTPASHLFIDQLLRATPDYLGASIALGSPTAAAASQLQVLAALHGHSAAATWSAAAASAAAAVAAASAPPPAVTADGGKGAAEGGTAGVAATGTAGAVGGPSGAAGVGGGGTMHVEAATGLQPAGGSADPAAGALQALAPSAAGSSAAAAAAAAAEYQHHVAMREAAQRELAASAHADLLRELLASPPPLAGTGLASAALGAATGAAAAAGTLPGGGLPGAAAAMALPMLGGAGGGPAPAAHPMAAAMGAADGAAAADAATDGVAATADAAAAAAAAAAVGFPALGAHPGSLSSFGSGSSADLLRDLLRPGTPDAWAFLRGSTPTPADALSLLYSGWPGAGHAMHAHHHHLAAATAAAGLGGMGALAMGGGGGGAAGGMVPPLSALPPASLGMLHSAAAADAAAMAWLSAAAAASHAPSGAPDPATAAAAAAASMMLHHPHGLAAPCAPPAPEVQSGVGAAAAAAAPKPEPPLQTEQPAHGIALGAARVGSTSIDAGGMLGLPDPMLQQPAGTAAPSGDGATAMLAQRPCITTAGPGAMTGCAPDPGLAPGAAAAHHHHHHPAPMGSHASANGGADHPHFHTLAAAALHHDVAVPMDTDAAGVGKCGGSVEAAGATAMLVDDGQAMGNDADGGINVDALLRSNTPAPGV